jgi:hypothetical protein
MGGTCNSDPEENHSENHTENKQGMFNLNTSWENNA